MSSQPDYNLASAQTGARVGRMPGAHALRFFEIAPNIRPTPAPMLTFDCRH